MRRVRMWRRQEQDAIVQGHIADDVGTRRKPEGLGIKKKGKQLRPGVGSMKVKALRAPVRNSFRDGETSASPVKTLPTLRLGPSSEDGGASAQATPTSKQRSSTRSRPTKAPSVSERNPVPPSRAAGTMVVNPPDQSVLGALRSQKKKRSP